MRIENVFILELVVWPFGFGSIFSLVPRLQGDDEKIRIAQDGTWEPLTK